ncbi:type II secretion system protein [Oceanobacillus halophilus]|uniref:type II secretion system protein n=1 Tax=Oceanobacillus halophilus TaxID=930130 RepID=UPI00131490B5|nr:type II secretion system protein [Oceanobacillus halophilus]
MGTINRGFTLIEVLVATGLLTTAISLLLPMISLLNNEQLILSERRQIMHELHDNLQPYLWKEKSAPGEYSSKINGTLVTYEYAHEGEYVEGCAIWQNVRKTNETLCIYGIKE